MLKLEDKKAVVAELAEVANNALSAVVVDYKGLTVAEMTELRANARKTQVYLRVVRNTLARRALQETAFACLQESLVGPLFLAFSQADPGAAARLIKEFIKTNEKLEVKALALDGVLLSPAELDKVASLPTYDEAVAQLLSVMQAPITKFVRTLVEPHTKLVRLFAAVRDQKQAAA